MNLFLRALGPILLVTLASSPAYSLAAGEPDFKSCQLNLSPGERVLKLDSFEVQNEKPVSVGIEIKIEPNAATSFSKKIGFKEVFKDTFRSNGFIVYAFPGSESEINGVAKVTEIAFSDGTKIKRDFCSNAFKVPPLERADSRPTILSVTPASDDSVRPQFNIEVSSEKMPNNASFSFNLPSGAPFNNSNYSSSSWRQESPGVWSNTYTFPSLGLARFLKQPIVLDRVLAYTYENGPNGVGKSIYSEPFLVDNIKLPFKGAHEVLPKSHVLPKLTALSGSLYTGEESGKGSYGSNYDQLRVVAEFQSAYPPSYLYVEGNFHTIPQEELPTLVDHQNIVNYEKARARVDGRGTIPSTQTRWSERQKAPDFVEAIGENRWRAVWTVSVYRSQIWDPDSKGAYKSMVGLMIPDKLSVELMNESFVYGDPSFAFAVGGDSLTKALKEDDVRQDEYLRDSRFELSPVQNENSPVSFSVSPTRKMVLHVAHGARTFRDPIQLIESTCSDKIVRPSCEVLYELSDEFYVYLWETHPDPARVGRPVLLSDWKDKAAVKPEVFGTLKSDFVFRKNPKSGRAVLKCDRYDWLPGVKKGELPANISVETWQREEMAFNPETYANENRIDPSTSFANVVFARYPGDLTSYQLTAAEDASYLNGKDVLSLKGQGDLFRVTSNDTAKIIWIHRLPNGERCQNTFGISRDGNAQLGSNTNIADESMLSSLLSSRSFAPVSFSESWYKDFSQGGYPNKGTDGYSVFPLKSLFEQYQNLPGPFGLENSYFQYKRKRFQ